MTSEISPSLPVNQPLSEQVAQEVRAKPKACFHNATLGLLFSNTASPLRHAHYVEGTCYSEIGIPVDHGWLELDGEIIDPTLTVVATRKLRFPNKGLARQTREAAIRGIAEGHKHRYEAIARYTYEEVYAHCVQHKGALPMTPREVLADAERRALGLPLSADYVAPE